MASAITYRTLGEPDVLTLTDVPEVVPGHGEVVVRVEAAGVNPLDAKLRSGLRPSPPITEPRRIGIDGAGVVTAVGDGVEGLRLGDPVAFTGASGSYATEVVVPAATAIPRPAGVTAAQGAAIGIPVSTAYQTLRSLAVTGADTLLVHGGSGAVGQAVIQLARLTGARVIATTSDARADRVRDLGGEPVGYGPGLVDRVRALAPEGPTAIIDIAGTDEALADSLTLLEDRSRIATLVMGARKHELGIQAYLGGSPDPLTPQQLAWRAEAIPLALALMAAGALSIELGPELPLAEAAEAHRLVAAGTHGKIVLLP